MAVLTALHSQWHPGEEAVQRMLGVPARNNPTVHGLKQAHAHRVTVSPLVAFGTLDDHGRPWVTVWGGEAGFCRPIAEDVLGVNSAADAGFDPVVQALFAPRRDTNKVNDEETNLETRDDGIVTDEVIRYEGGKVMAALSIDLATRDRLKLAGRFIAGSAVHTTPGVANLQMAFAVEEALGNCPKYLNKKHIVPHVPAPELVSLDKGLPLPREAVEVIEKADLFFIASKHGDGSMDVNHRGGSPGFVRVFRNEFRGEDDTDDGGLVLIYPEYSGNRLYQTLGNLNEDPVVGLVVPDFDTSDVLYLTGRTTILVAERAAAYMPHAKLAVRIDVTEARFVRDGLPFRGSFIDHSPYNPPVRPLATEKDAGQEDGSANAIAMAKLLRRQVITPTISRYVFKLAPTKSDMGEERGGNRSLRAWYPGQHVTFDFSPELDHGYSHMRDEDPQSLNDDFVRTFTVSAPISHQYLPDVDAASNEEMNSGPPTLRNGVEPELEIVVRRHGSATALLARWNLRVPLEIPVLGFGGVDDFRMPVSRADDDGSISHAEKSVFVAGGVGITPLLAQAGAVLGARSDELEVLWSLRAEDLPLAVDAFTNIDGLGRVTKLFVTGAREEGSSLLDTVRSMGAVAVERRMVRDDVLGAGERGRRKFFCCTGPGMMKTLLQWMEGEDVVFESFEY